MKTFLILFTGIVSLFSFAQDGSLDTSFGNNGTVQTDIDGDTDLAASITQQIDGKLLVAGSFMMQGQAFPSIARYTLNGALDTSFGNNGVTVFNQTGYENDYYDIVLTQSDGKIIAGGPFNINANYLYAVHRFLADGSIDVNYGDNGKIVIFQENIYKGQVAILDDDSLLAVGRIYENGVSKVALKKYLPNGALDTSFGNDGVVLTGIGNESSSAIKVALAQDHKIVVLADSRDNNISSQVLLRYMSNGTLDTTFGSNGMVAITNEPDFSSNIIALYNDGKIAVASSYLDWQFRLNFNLIYRYLPDGSLDTTFGNNGAINPNSSNLAIYKIEVQQNQRLLIFGELTDFFEGGGPFFMLRYHLGGHLDTSFNFSTPSNEYFVSDMLVQQDGKIVCLANTAWYDGQEDIIMERHLNDPLSVLEFKRQNMMVYPNPSNGVFTVERKLFSETEAYQITDIAGKIIVSGELNVKQTQIDLSSAQNGVYFLKVSNDVFRFLKN